MLSNKYTFLSFLLITLCSFPNLIITLCFLCHFFFVCLFSSSDVKRENKHIFKSNDGEKSDGHVLRHFFDDWPRSVQEPDNVGITNNSTTGSMKSSTSLSISMPGNLSSDVSLKLSTGNGEVPGHAETRAHSNRQSGWTAGWNSSPMGGPLAEALRSSNSNSSPTSVLHQLPRGSASETCVVSS